MEKNYRIHVDPGKGGTKGEFIMIHAGRGGASVHGHVLSPEEVKEQYKQGMYADYDRAMGIVK